MPSSDSGESRRQSKPHNHAGAMAPPEQEQLPCPRCDSTNTKFCYYNNYNFSQPRHFCKSCRRYWTHGGTLRDIPVGGGSRKNAKRSRTAVSGTSSSSSAASASATQVTMVPVSGGHGGPVQFGGGVVVEGDHVKGNNVNVCGGSGSFTSLLSSPQGHGGFLALGGFGLGLGPGLEDVGFGMGRAAWPFPGMADGGNMGGAVAGPGVGNTWQFESGEGGFVGGECFSWPGLAISTTGNGLK